MTFRLTTLSIMKQYWFAVDDYAVCHLCPVSFMLSVANKHTMLSVVVPSVVILNVVAPPAHKSLRA